MQCEQSLLETQLNLLKARIAGESNFSRPRFKLDFWNPHFGNKDSIYVIFFMDPDSKGDTGI